MLAFSSLGHGLFGSTNESYRDLWSSIFMLSGLLTGSVRPSDPQSYMMRTFIFTFCVFVTASLLVYVSTDIMFQYNVSFFIQIAKQLQIIDRLSCPSVSQYICIGLVSLHLFYPLCWHFTLFYTCAPWWLRSLKIIIWIYSGIIFPLLNHAKIVGSFLDKRTVNK